MYFLFPIWLWFLVFGSRNIVIVRLFMNLSLVLVSYLVFGLIQIVKLKYDKIPSSIQVRGSIFNLDSD